MAVTKKTETRAVTEKAAKTVSEPAVKASAAVSPEAVKAAVIPETAVKTEAAISSVQAKKETEKKKAVQPGKEPVKRASAGREASKKAAAKAPAKTAAKAAIKTKVYVQYHGKEVCVDTLTEEVKKAYKATGHKVSEIRTVDLYVKPEEDVAYFVVNGEGSEECRIYL